MDIGEHTKVKSVLFLKFNSSQSEFTTGLIFDDQNKGQQPYVLIETTHYLKYLDQFSMVLLETFTTGLIL